METVRIRVIPVTKQTQMYILEIITFMLRKLIYLYVASLNVTLFLICCILDKVFFLFLRVNYVEYNMVYINNHGRIRKDLNTFVNFFPKSAVLNA